MINARQVEHDQKMRRNVERDFRRAVDLAFPKYAVRNLQVGELEINGQTNEIARASFSVTLELLASKEAA